MASGCTHLGEIKFTSGLAIDHREGKAVVLFYRQDHWEQREFKDAEKP